MHIKLHTLVLLILFDFWFLCVFCLSFCLFLSRSIAFSDNFCVASVNTSPYESNAQTNTHENRDNRKLCSEHKHQCDDTFVRPQTHNDAIFIYFYFFCVKQINDNSITTNRLQKQLARFRSMHMHTNKTGQIIFILNTDKMKWERNTHFLLLSFAVNSNGMKAKKSHFHSKNANNR